MYLGIYVLEAYAYFDQIKLAEYYTIQESLPALQG